MGFKQMGAIAESKDGALAVVCPGGQQAARNGA